MIVIMMIRDDDHHHNSGIHSLKIICFHCIGGILCIAEGSSDCQFIISGGRGNDYHLPCIYDIYL